MDEEARNEMLVADDKYEAYRLGYSRGHKRGYGFREQQDRAELAGFKCTETRLTEGIERMGEEIKGRMHMEKHLRNTIAGLEHELDDKIQRIVVLRHVNEQMKAKELNSVYGKFGRPF